MQDQNIWYVYQASQQLGPFGKDQVKQMVLTKMIAQDAFIFKAGWKDWRPLEDCFEDIGIPFNMRHETRNRRSAAPRFNVAGKIIVHNNGQLIIGKGVNISRSGVFIETKDQLFTLGEVLKLTIKCDGFSKSFHADAQVIRFNSDPKYPLGYGMKFESIDPHIIQEIDRIIQKKNAEDQQVRSSIILKK